MVDNIYYVNKRVLIISLITIRNIIVLYLDKHFGQMFVMQDISIYHSHLFYYLFHKFILLLYCTRLLVAF
jgi:hypothetical protein